MIKVSSKIIGTQLGSLSELLTLRQFLVLCLCITLFMDKELPFRDHKVFY